MLVNLSSKIHSEKSAESVEEIINLPFYGGLKGQVLKIKQHRDGSVTSKIVAKPKDIDQARSGFDSNFNKIQQAAAQLVAIQEAAKDKGVFSPEDNKFYADNLLQLGLAAQELAKLQQSGQIEDFSKLLQGSSLHSHQAAMIKPEKPIKEDVPIFQEDPYDGDLGDSVSVNAPKKEASIAESKPVGLSIVGPGGVASSKPNAVAIAGKDGLSVASPKGTAIAGVSPEEVAALGVHIPTRKHTNQVLLKNKYGLRNGGILAGPDSSEEESQETIKNNFRETLLRQTDDSSEVEDILSSFGKQTLPKRYNHKPQQVVYLRNNPRDEAEPVFESGPFLPPGGNRFRDLVTMAADGAQKKKSAVKRSHSTGRYIYVPY